jgi:hypothetical protein
MFPFHLIFYLLPPLIVAYAFARRTWVFVLAMWPLFIVLGFVLLVSQVGFNDFLLEREIRSQPKPPQELVDRYVGDGGRNLAIATYGWLFAACYYLIWLAVWAVASVIRASLRWRPNSSQA